MMHEFDEDANFDTEEMLFGDFIKKIRRLMGLNQEDFGLFIGGYSQKNISAWEQKCSTPNYDEIRRILDFLGYSLLIVKKDSDVSHKTTVNKLVNAYLESGISKVVV